jgi:competence protein ComEA
MWDWDKRYVAAAIAVVLMLGVGGGMKYKENRQRAEALTAISLPAAPLAEEISAPEAPPPDIVVYVGGAVQNPGIYTLPENARVHEAVERAVPGADADLDVIGMARVLEDGETLYIPSHSETEADAGSAGSWSPPSGTAASGKININQASAEELSAGLPGVGAVLAGNIVEYRKEHGKFATIEDLRNVSGIGDKKYAALSALITVR